MTIIDTATVSALLFLVGLAVLAVVVVSGIGLVRTYAAGRPARTTRRLSAPAPYGARVAH